MKNISVLLGASVVLAAALASCSQSETVVDPPAPSSYDLLQAKVLATTCATSGCHVAGSAYAEQSGLVLEAPVAYANLVGVAPKNDAARADGLRRVAPGSPDSSFLFIKITDPGHEAAYGAQMPLGSDQLPAGTIEFIRQWIAAGAPRTGVVADASLLDDTTEYITPFTPLPVPAPGEGFQITTGLFDVAPHFERELFIYRRIGNDAPIYVNRIETAMRAGSHHLVLYTLPSRTPARSVPAADVIRDIRNPDGTMNEDNMQPMAYHVFFSGAMTPHATYSFPPGVALKLPAGQMIDMNSHYVNATDRARPGEAYANFYTVDSAAVQHVAKPLFLNYDEFQLAPGRQTTVTHTFQFGNRQTIFLLNSHMHKRGKHFVIRIAGGPRNGEIVYESSDWSHPPVKVFDEPLVLEAGQGLTSEVTYENETTHTIRFGLTSEDEMDIIYAYAY
jgi:hypothetical protein